MSPLPRKDCWTEPRARNLFNGPAAGLTRGTRPGEDNRVIPQADFDPSGAEPAHLKGDMRGLTEKLQDPAWSGALAANAGNISLTDAERAVPMPGSAHLVQRLDRNPFIGGGMRDHSRDHI